jgi:uncharacterized protein YndB with AHSA1/START domain
VEEQTSNALPRSSGSLKVTTPNDRDIVMTRVFNAPRRLVYEAFTTPALVQRWLGVFGDWTLDVCEIDLRVGGRYRWVWRNNPCAQEMGVSGTYLEIVPGERIVSTEQFDDAWYEGEAVGTLVLSEENGRTTLTQTVRYASKEIRDNVLKTPIEQGVDVSYDNLAELLKNAA